MDWNWFFSSFCQSAAALIGIIGAFIISRLLGLSEKISSTISQFDNLVIECNKITASISKRSFSWYTKSIVRYGTDIKKEIRAGNFDTLSRDEILKKIYDSDNRLYKNDKAVYEVFNELYKDNKPKRDETKLCGGLPIMNISSINLDISPAGIWDNINKEKGAIDLLEIEAKTIIQHFKQNLQDLDSFKDTIRPLRVIIIMLMVAFPITVIYPLHFMPLPTNQNPTITFNLLTILKSLISLKSFLLTAFFVTIEGIFYYFLTLTDQQNKRLKKAKQNNSDDLRNIKNYSEYFEED